MVSLPPPVRGAAPRGACQPGAWAADDPAPAGRGLAPAGGQPGRGHRSRQRGRGVRRGRGTDRAAVAHLLAPRAAGDRGPLAGRAARGGDHGQPAGRLRRRLDPRVQRRLQAGVRTLAGRRGGSHLGGCAAGRCQLAGLRRQPGPRLIGVRRRGALGGCGPARVGAGRPEVGTVLVDGAVGARPCPVPVRTGGRDPARPGGADRARARGRPAGRGRPRAGGAVAAGRRPGRRPRRHGAGPSSGRDRRHPRAQRRADVWDRLCGAGAGAGPPGRAGRGRGAAGAGVGAGRDRQHGGATSVRAVAAGARAPGSRRPSGRPGPGRAGPRADRAVRGSRRAARAAGADRASACFADAPASRGGGAAQRAGACGPAAAAHPAVEPGDRPRAVCLGQHRQEPCPGHLSQAPGRHPGRGGRPRPRARPAPRVNGPRPVR